MEVKCIATIGAGRFGCGIAHLGVRAGYRLILEDIVPSSLEQGMAWVARALDDDVSQGRLDAAGCDNALLRLTTAHSAENACREADLVIETVADEEELKLELFTIFDKFAKPGAIFASTTKTLSITALAAITVCPERCIGTRFSGGVAPWEAVEIVRGRETSEETVRACREVARRCGMRANVTYEQESASASGSN